MCQPESGYGTGWTRGEAVQLLLPHPFSLAFLLIIHHIRVSRHIVEWRLAWTHDLRLSTVLLMLLIGLERPHMACAGTEVALHQFFVQA